MGTKEILLYIFIGHIATVQSFMPGQDALFPHDFERFFDNRPFPFDMNFDFSPNDAMFGPWPAPTPDFHMFADFPPTFNVPQVEVFCDESKLTLLVGKRSDDAVLTGEEIQLGDGCLSNGELPNHIVFTYRLDECGTTRVMQNGLGVFTNSLHLNLKNPPKAWWPTPSTVHISCIPKRSLNNKKSTVSTMLPERSNTYNIKAMNPSWTRAAESNDYRRGEVLNLQVSANTRPRQQLFIQSCSVSASPDPQFKPKHAVIMNKGCTAPSGAPHAAVQFVPSMRNDVVNFVLNTSFLISEMYVHCSVLVSDQGVTFGSKSCNYNLIQSSWEELSGATDVCECCSSKCKGLPIKHLSEDAKAIVSAGPFVIKDKEEAPSLEVSVPAPQEPSRQSEASHGAAAEDAVVAGTSLSRSKFPSPPQGVVVLREDPVIRLTLWLPGQGQDEHGDNLKTEDKLSNDIPELQPSTRYQESTVNTKMGNIGDPKWNFLTLVDGWASPNLDEAAIEEESRRKRWFGRSNIFSSKARQETEMPLQDDKDGNVFSQGDFNKRKEDLIEMQADAAVMSQDGANDAQPIIRSKIEFSKGADGSQTLSYEEEAVKHQERESKGKHGHKRGVFSTFLDLLRRMNAAE